MHIADCDPDRCQSSSNDQLIRLYADGIQVAANDDYCGWCSVIDYSVTSDACQTYTLQQGCFSNLRCSGNFTITLTSSGAQNTTGHE